jgi:fructose-1,6-bisphosphatase/sedoheptulose 1,7-bisphosphatase-like protein
MPTDKCGRDTDRNVLQKEVEKKLKYKILCMKIRRMWNMKCMIVSLQVITGATGIATEGLKKVLKAISGKRSIDSLQNTAVVGTSHIIRKVLQCET